MEKQFLDQTVLADLEERLPEFPHLQELNAQMTIEEWEESGEPYVWHIVDEKDKWQLLADYGHGLMALFLSSKLVNVGRDSVSSEDGTIAGLSGPHPITGIYFKG